MNERCSMASVDKAHYASQASPCSCPVVLGQAAGRRILKHMHTHAQSGARGAPAMGYSCATPAPCTPPSCASAPHRKRGERLEREPEGVLHARRLLLRTRPRAHVS